MAKKPDRISESDLLLPTLRLLAAAPEGYMSTSRLISELTKQFEPEGEDADILEGRQDTKFSQIVRNMISHKASPTNIIALGYAERIGRGMKITEAGRKYLESKGG